MKNALKFFTVLFCILLVIGWKDKQNYLKINNAATATKTDIHKIVLKEAVDGGNYVYLNVDENGRNYWMAITIFKGVVVLDKDFGYGYMYSILLEDAKLVK